MDASSDDHVLVLPDGRRLGYAEYGDPQGRLIAFFHGMPGSRLGAAMFAAAAQAEGARLIAADRPGYATSSPARASDLRSRVADVAALMDTLAVPAFAILGVSGGAPYALACAAWLPGRVTGCALMSGIGPLALPHAMDGMFSVNRVMFTIGRLLPALPGWLLPRQMRGQLASMQKHVDEGTSPLPDVPASTFALLVADQAEAIRSGGQGIAGDMRIVTHDWGFPLEQISVPTRLWHGAEDNLAPVALARYMAERIPGATLTLVPGAGHAGTFAHADEAIRWLVSIGRTRVASRLAE